MTFGEIASFDPVSGCGFILSDDRGPEVYVESDDLGGQEVYVGTPVKFRLYKAPVGPRPIIRILLPGIDARSRSCQSDTRNGGMAEYPLREGARLDIRAISERDYAEEFTDVLTAVQPDIPFVQLVEIRTQLVKDAIQHGWVKWLSNCVT